MMTKLKIGVIGGSGFIGKHLVAELSKYKNIENLKVFGRQPIFINSKDIKPEYYQINLLNSQSYKDKIVDLDIIYYLASETTPLSSWENPTIEITKNLTPLIEFLEIIKNSTVKKIVFTSSAGTIYGPSASSKDETNLTTPFSPHGIGKLAMEHFLEYYRVNYNLNYDVFRISNAYGPGFDISNGLGLINTLLENLIQSKTSTIFGNGKAFRNFIFIDDIVKTLGYSTKFSYFESNILNLASNENVTIIQVIKTIEKITQKKLEIQYINQRNSDNPTIKISNNKLLKKIPELSLTVIEKGIELTYLNLKNNNL